MNRFLMILIAVLAVNFASAQSRVAFLYSGEVFESHPKYIEAQKRISEFANNQQAIIDKELENAKKLYTLYTNSQSRMSSSDSENLKKLIISSEAEANDLQERVFGQGGELEKLQKELLVPIEDELVEVVNTIAKAEGYDLVFDLTIVKNTIYQSQSVNITNKVMQTLGINKTEL